MQTASTSTSIASIDDTMVITPKLLLCPYCFEDIPIIKLYFLKEEMYLKLKCSCSTIEKRMQLANYLNSINCTENYNRRTCSLHSDLIGLKYCIECFKWLCSHCINAHQGENTDFNSHTLLEQKVKVYCKTHRLDYAYYCKNCSINICKECKLYHLNHKCIDFTQVDISQLEEDLKTAIQSRIQCDNKQLIYQKTNQYKYTNIQTLPWQIQEDIKNQDLGFKRFKNKLKCNQLLNELYHCMYYTSKQLSTHTCYQLMMLSQTLKQNLEPFTFGLSFQTMENYFEYHYILIQEDEYSTIGQFKTIDTFEVSCMIELDINRIATGLYNNKICIWNLTTFDLITSFKAHNSGIYALCILRNDKFASSGFEKVIKIWDALSYTCLKTISLNQLSYHMLQLKDNNIAFSFSNPVIKILSADNCNDYHKLYDTGNDVQCMIQLHNGYLATCSTSRVILIWNLTTMKEDSYLTGHTKTVNSIIELEDNVLASCSDDKTIRIWDLLFNCCTTTIEINEINSGLVKLNHRQFASCSINGVIKIWNNVTCCCESTLVSKHKSDVKLLVCSNGIVVCSNGQNNLFALKSTIFNKHV